jgi:hypothetical protein
MQTDILIAGLMTLASVVTALVILLEVGRAIREEPRLKATPPPASGVPAGAGW